MGEQDEAPAADAGTTDWHQLVLAAVHDPDRLAAVQATGLLDTAAEESFDRLARLAATVLRVPWVFVTLVDEKRSFWKSCVGVELDDVSPRQNSVDESFCQYVIGSGDRVVVTDARLDERTKSNISIELMGVISWAGVPLRGGDRQILGTMCAVDSVVRNWTVADMELLETLAGAASSEIQLRTALATANDATKELAAELATREVIVERSRMLADLAQQLSAAESSDAVCSIMTNLGRSVLAAEFSNVAVLDEEQRHLNLVHSSWLVSEVAQRYATLALTADAPLAHAVVTRAPVLLADLDEIAARYPGLLEDTVRSGLVATASFPLFRSDGSASGAFGVGWAAPIEFTPMMRSLLTTVAQMCAQALDRSLLGDARGHFVLSLQRALLPRIGQRVGLDIAAEYIPANNALGFGGDWYDVIALSPTQTALIVGDVCGHGIDAAATMAQIRGSINALVRLFAGRLDEIFDQAEMQFGGSEKDFVATLAVYVVDAEENSVRYVSAGHPPAILLAPDGTHELLEDGRRPVLGIGGPRPSPAHATFRPGAVLVAYTDGLVEQGHSDLDSGIAALISELEPIREEGADQIVKSVALRHGLAPIDDVAFAVVRRVVDG